MKKTRDFLLDLQQNLFIRYFTDDYFKSLVTILKLQVYKCKKSNCWVTRILLLEQLFDYTSKSNSYLFGVRFSHRIDSKNLEIK